MDKDSLLFWRCRGHAPQHGLDPGYQFPRAEGFDHIVVRAQREPGHPVDLLAPCREHDYRHLRRLPQTAADLPSVHFRNHQVEDHQVGVVPAGKDQCDFAVAGGDR